MTTETIKGPREEGSRRRPLRRPPIGLGELEQLFASSVGDADFTETTMRAFKARLCFLTRHLRAELAEQQLVNDDLRERLGGLDEAIAELAAEAAERRLGEVPRDQGDGVTGADDASVAAAANGTGEGEPTKTKKTAASKRAP